MNEKDLVTIVSKGVSEGVERALAQHKFGCCKEHCSEKCGFSPAEHAQKHQKADRLVRSVENAENGIKAAVIRTVTVFLIGVFGAGIVITIYEIANKTPDAIKKSIGGG